MITSQPAREGAQRVQVAVVADDDIADDLRRGVLRGVTEELEPDAERDARLVCHTSELTAADHADYRERHASKSIGRAAGGLRTGAPDYPPVTVSYVRTGTAPCRGAG